VIPFQLAKKSKIEIQQVKTDLSRDQAQNWIERDMVELS
jgi:hypothetical protein